MKERPLLNYKGNDRNFYLFLNKPIHTREHLQMLGGKLKLEQRNQYKELDNFKFGAVECAKIVKRHQDNVNQLYDNNVKVLEMKPDWRLSLGLGGASVFETDITLHHIYGIPYIPASSIKGVVRSYIIETVFNNNEAEAIMNKGFCDVFGCSKEHEIHTKGDDGKIYKSKNLSWYGQEFTDGKRKDYDRRGAISFFDAFPTKAEDITISMDLMNVHYSDYYNSPKEKNGIYKKEEMKPPGDWSSPTIINFLTVKNAVFQFLLASNKDFDSLKIENKTVDEWLSEALENHGIGAKTAVGYGYMS